MCSLPLPFAHPILVAGTGFNATPFTAHARVAAAAAGAAGRSRRSSGTAGATLAPQSSAQELVSFSPRQALSPAASFRRRTGGGGGGGGEGEDGAGASGASGASGAETEAGGKEREREGGLPAREEGQKAEGAKGAGLPPLPPGHAAAQQPQQQAQQPQQVLLEVLLIVKVSARSAGIVVV